MSIQNSILNTQNPPNSPPPEVLAEVALTPAEYALIVERLGRAPNQVELGMFGAMWSEHCGYKHSKPLLRGLPTTGPRVLTAIGEENAGAVDVGEGLAVVFKIESHNHPSAIEPVQGAATGVGGIVRDIFTMGARPIALADSLRFGPLSEPRNRYLFGGVVAGIGWYGNCLGVPTVAGEVVFAPGYSGNPLVNALCLGLIPHDKLTRARARGVGNPVLLVGADTGRDGIHGATFASVELDTGEKAQERRPAVQVGNPFLERVLMEACLELLDQHQADIVAMQDLGAAGLTSSAVECASRGEVGIEIDVAHVARREAGMAPYEVMLSESQERMLVIVRAGAEARVRVVFGRWGLHSDIVGQVTDDGLIRVRDGEQVAAEIPVQLLTDPPLYAYPVVEPADLAARQALDLASVPPPADLGEALLQLLASPNICSKETVYRQYDHHVGINTLQGPGGDAAVLRLPVAGSRRAIALTTDGNGRLCGLDPETGGALVIAEAARNLVCVGAEPLAVTDCLNFGNPEKPEVYYQLARCVAGMSRACEALGTPVVSGNVSLYNETAGQAIDPTPIVGMVGLIEDCAQTCAPGFSTPGDVVVLLGEGWDDDLTAGLGGSEYLAHLHGRVAGRPHCDLEREQRLHQVALAAIRRGLLRSAHDCAEGGLAVALAESAILGGIGARIGPLVGAGARADLAWFGERAARIVASVAPDRLDALGRLADEAGLPWRKLGEVGGERLALADRVDLALAVLERAWRNGLTPP